MCFFVVTGCEKWHLFLLEMYLLIHMTQFDFFFSFRDHKVLEELLDSLGLKEKVYV